MTVQNPPIFLQAGTHPAEDVRRMLGAQMSNRSGVVNPNDLEVTQTATASMQVEVATGRAWVAGTTATYQGTYFAENRGVTTLTLDTADATNGRYDLICLKIKDSVYSGAANEAELVVVAGTPSGAPAVPATPADSLALASVLVGATVTSVTDANIADLRNGTVPARGGFTICTSTNRPASPSQGEVIYETDTKRMLVWDAGSNWMVFRGHLSDEGTSTAFNTTTELGAYESCSLALPSGNWLITATGSINYSIAGTYINYAKLKVGPSYETTAETTLFSSGSRAALSTLQLLVPITGASLTAEFTHWRSSASGTVIIQEPRITAIAV